MLREMGEFLERWTANSPLILVLEDLHWSDYATLDLLSYLARRGRPPSRWLIVGSYRPVEVIVSEHPLKGVKQELQLHGLCQELPLELLSEQDVAQYLRLRFPESPMPDPLIQAIYTRTEGLPLCLVHVVDDLIAGGARLRERRAAGRYGFIHAFYHEIAYARLSPTPRAGLHRRLGEWLEMVCGVRAGELAAELALHFEQGQDYRKAVNYLRQAAENAIRRYANQEAIGYLTRALELAERLPEAEGASTRAAVLEQRGVVRRSMGDMAGTLEDHACLLREPLS